MQNADPLDGIDRNWDFFIACFGSGRDACEKTGTACGGGSSRRVRSSFGCEFALWFHRGFSFNEPIGAGGVLCSRDSGSNNAFVPEPSHSATGEPNVSPSSQLSEEQGESMDQGLLEQEAAQQEPQEEFSTPAENINDYVGN